MLPGLPSNCGIDFSSDTLISTPTWTQMGEAKKLPCEPKTLTHTEPTILAWKWKIQSNVADHVGLLAVADSPEDPIPDTNKVDLDNIENLVRNEKRIGVSSRCEQLISLLNSHYNSLYLNSNVVLHVGHILAFNRTNIASVSKI
jgi:hypothetical protein